MRHDQGRDRDGRFDTTESNHRMFEEERLEYPVGCKVTGRELRMYSVLFDQHRKIFGWQTMSDMYRDLLRDGFKVAGKMVVNPDPELVQMAMETDQMERAQRAAQRHVHHEKAVDFTAERLEVLKRNNDYGQIRALLQDFWDKTKALKDPVIRGRRRDEFERRGWDKQLKELNKGVSMSEFEDD